MQSNYRGSYTFFQFLVIPGSALALAKFTARPRCMSRNESTRLIN